MLQTGVNAAYSGGAAPPPPTYQNGNSGNYPAPPVTIQSGVPATTNNERQVRIII